MMVYELFFCSTSFGLYQTKDGAEFIMSRWLDLNPEYRPSDFWIQEREVIQSV